MKFKVEKKDLIIFIAFCVFLLYLCAIGVLNASSIATEGRFYGFLPFKAFTSKYIGMTFFLFLAALIGIFMAVKSYIFDRDKGFGFSVGSKKEKGYSRWATDAEFKKGLEIVNIKDEHIDAAGIALHSKKGKMWVDNGEDHYLVMGATGSGKSVIVAKPMIKLLAKHGESMILTDPKGELYEETAELLKANDYNIITLNFRDPQRGNAWNPMSLPYKLYKEGNTDKAIELLDDLALNILYEEKSSGDPFWEKTAADYFTGLALGLFEDGTPEQINVNSVNLMSSLGEERFGGPNNNYAKEYFNSKDPSKAAYINASGTVFTADETKQGIIATFKQKMKLFSERENLSEMLSYSDFDMREIGRKKTAVFLIVQDEKKTLHPLATIFIKQCYETLIDVAQESGGKLPFRTNFILDEFANMPPLKDVTTMVTAARSRLIRFTFIIQNFAQLTQVYGKENGDTIRGNCNLLYLISSEIAALEEISKMCGEVKSKDKEKTASTPLVTVSDLQRLSQFEIIVLRRRMFPYKTKFETDFQVDWGRTYPKATPPSREKKELQLFDIREFVKKKKAEKMEAMGASNPMGGASPFGGMNPFAGPFGGSPMSGANPFSAGSSMGGANPFGGGLPPFLGGDNNASDEGGFNIDDLVKKIDAKIAEIEKEENETKAIEETKSTPFEELISNKEKPSVDNNVEDNTDKNENKESEVIDAEVEEAKPQSSVADMYDDKTNDDDFFDDFFSDD
ncbi:MAG: type IV secretory system conjugative DNA transfer family protein [Firmicutes bacterium]|nr:type IV secretory system conjugative DNA transfer family protein [Bacillota bacterium]